MARPKNKKKAELLGAGADLLSLCIAISEQLDQRFRLYACVPKRRRGSKVQLFLYVATCFVHSVCGRRNKKVAAKRYELEQSCLVGVAARFTEIHPEMLEGKTGSSSSARGAVQKSYL